MELLKKIKAVILFSAVSFYSYGQNNVVIYFEGEELDTSSISVLRYEHLLVSNGPILLSKFSKAQKKEFEQIIDYPTIFIIDIQGNRHKLYVEPGDVNYISIKDKNSIEVFGDRSLENKIFYECFGSREVLKFPKPKSPSLTDRVLALEEKMSDLDSIYSIYQTSTSKNFSQFLKASIDGYRYFVLDVFLGNFNLDELSTEEKEVYIKNHRSLNDLKFYDQPYSRSYMNAMTYFIKKDIEYDDDLTIESFNELLKIHEDIPVKSRMNNHMLIALINSAIYKAKTLDELDYATKLFYSLQNKFVQFPKTRELLEYEIEIRKAQFSIKNLENFELSLFSGQPKNVLDFDNDFLIIDFWASWCEPCVKSLPKLKELVENNSFLEAGLINTDKSKEKGQRIYEKYALEEFAINFHATAKETNELMKKLSFDSLPHYILIDAKGKVYYHGSSFNDLQNKIFSLYDHSVIINRNN